MLLKKSSTPDTYWESDVLTLLEVELDEIKSYLAKFFIKKDQLANAFASVIMEQFDKHLASVACEAEINPSIYQESLFVKTCQIISATLAEMGKKREANQIEDKLAELTK